MLLTFVCVNTWTGHVDVLLEEVRLYMSPKVRLLYRPVELVSHSRFSLFRVGEFVHFDEKLPVRTRDWMDGKYL